MPVTSLPDWIAEFAKPQNLWYIKRLSGNDTLANGAHQAGFYVPKHVAFTALPSLNDRSQPNPDLKLEAFIDSHPERRVVRPIWYNKKLFGKTRNETRITGWGGATSALLDPDSTGALTAFVFVDATEGRDASRLHVWVCEGYQDEVIEDLVGPVDPGKTVIWRPGVSPDLFLKAAVSKSCRLSGADVPPEWLAEFPAPTEIVAKTVELRPLQSETPDHRLIERRNCEFEIFSSVEEAVETPRVARGFNSLDAFLVLAQSILQRRKSRSGRSLELHARAIFMEEGLVQGADFDHGAVSEGEKRPDFLFPSQAAYEDASFPSDRLRMLGAKTTLRDRWRQVLNEADRIEKKHLLTLQEGVSKNQFAEMTAANIQLVVPTPLHKAYAEDLRPHLLSLEQFLSELRVYVGRREPS